MSQNNTRPITQRGFCNAIFASSPFDKENESPNVDSSSNNKTNISCKKNIINSLPTDELSNSDSKAIKTGSRENSSDSSYNLFRSSSDITLHNHDSTTGQKFTSEEKLKVKSNSNARLSGEKTPVTHFCTPKNILEHKSSSKKPIKRFFSDNNLPQTPDCFNSVHLETPRIKNDINAEEQAVFEGENSNLTVGIRVRPLSYKEQNEPKISSIVEINNQTITVDCETSQHTFMYDYCFMSDPNKNGHASQEVVFNVMALPLVQNAFEGYNVCLFAYGQTGSGKSYSMMGTEPNSCNINDMNPDAGIIPRFCYEIFSKVSQNSNNSISVEISYFEIYNEKIHDLLINNTNGNKRAPLKVREHPVFGPYIVDLSQHSVRNYEDLKTWLKVGNSQRATAATGMNEKSSRSHSIFSIILTQEKSKDSNKSDDSRRSKINLVDLAGSERLSNTCASGDRLREGVSINKSLLTLGKVIGCLAENTNNRRRGFVPYRESVLTWLLKESLGGNSRTAMLGTVSPANIHLEETLATLRYACQARAIVNRVRINEDPHEKLIRQLKAEVQRLRGMKDGYEKQLGLTPRRLVDAMDSCSSDGPDDVLNKQREIDQLRVQLKKMEEQLQSSQKSWQEKLREAEEKKDSQLNYLLKCGIAINLDFPEKVNQPCLINLAADPMLSGTLLYLIPLGLVHVGKNKKDGNPSTKKLDIVLDGPLIKENHCTIENNEGKLTLYPEKDAECFVNGQLVYSKVRLKHGDRLVIGGNHYFKVCMPQDAKADAPLSVQQVDFEYAHQEVMRIQEEKLRAELEESKQKAMKELENAKREVEIQLDNQKHAYEMEIKQLGHNLEEKKKSLEDMKRVKRELEHEKEILANEIEINNKLKKLEVEQDRKLLSPYKTNFLQELQEILNETTADAETALAIKTSIDAMNTGGVSLHELQLLVREASERCKDVGVNYEFQQQQMICDKTLKPVIRIRDRDSMKETFWEPMRFLNWVHRLRDHDLETTLADLQDPDAKWESFQESGPVCDSIYDSRISINLTPVKKQLNESLSQFSIDTSFLDSSIDETSESILQKRREDMNQCFIQIQLASKTLKKLCEQYESKDLSSKATKTLNEVQKIINELKKTFDENSASINDSKEQNKDANLYQKGGNETSNEGADTKEMNKKFCPNYDLLPGKSSLKSDNLTIKTENGPRSVRFE